MSSLPRTLRERARQLTLLALLASGAGAAGVACAEDWNAAPQTAVPTVTVRYDDLDLNTVDGAKALYARIRAAARTVCGHAPLYDSRAHEATVACQQKSIARAVNDVHNEKLSALLRTPFRFLHG